MQSRQKVLRLGGAAVIAVAFLGLTPKWVAGQTCAGDCNGDGIVDIAELVRGVAIALGNRPLSDCSQFDRNGNGRVEINELIKAVNNARCGCNLPCPTPRRTHTRTRTATPTTTPTFTPPPTATPLPTRGGSMTTAIEACDDDCQAALRRCGDEVFFEEYGSVGDCTDECVSIAEDFASEAANFQGCVDAQVRFIECCTRRGRCGEIPDGCDAEFNDAASACGGSFGGCPLIFF